MMTAAYKFKWVYVKNLSYRTLKGKAFSHCHIGHGHQTKSHLSGQEMELPSNFEHSAEIGNGKSAPYGRVL